MLNEKFDALCPAGEAPDWLVKNGFEPAEESDRIRWMWATGPESSFEVSRLPHGVRVFLEARIPEWQTGVALYVGGRLLAEWNTPGTHGAQFTVLADELPCKIQFRHLVWNRTDGTGALPEDLRPVAFVLSRGEFEPTVETKGRICPYPFARMEVPGEPFVPCCSAWLTDEYKALSGSGWNGDAALKLRGAILDGSYRYCRLETCGMQLWPREKVREMAAAQQQEFPLSEAALVAIERNELRIPEGPGGITLMADPRCNLACGSCRQERITELSPENAQEVERAGQILDQHSAHLRMLKLAGDGDPMFSPFLRDLIVNAPAQFPRLEAIELLTNGLLLNEDNWRSLGEGRRKVRRVSVSVDAGDAVTYASVRGGSWELLLKNLRFLARLRAEGEIEFFGLNFTVRAENFRSLHSFLKLAGELRVDEVYLSRLNDWAPRMKIDFSREAIHLKSHPLHEEFRREWVTLKLHGVKIRTNFPSDVFPMVGPTFCPLPFGHLFLSEQGEPYACCYGLDGQAPQRGPDGAPLRARSREDLEKAWNSDFMRGLRQDLWHGRKPDYCSRCFVHEAHGMQSLRVVQLEHLSEDLGALALSVDHHGGVPLRYVSLDLRFGNNCNLMCRMCSPKSSRKLVDEFERLKPLSSFEEYRDLDWYQSPWLRDLVLENADTMREMHFAGGEPFLIPEVRELLGEMVKRGRARHITLSFNTNLTVLPQEIKELLPCFKGTHLIGSLDGVDRWNELIRWPSKFAIVEKNLRDLDRTAKDLRLEVLVLNTTVQIHNVLLIPDIVAFCHSFTSLRPFPVLGLLRGPDHLSIQALSPRQKWAVERRLRRWVARMHPEWMSRNEARGFAGQTATFERWLDGMIEFMWAQDKSEHWPEFLRISGLQDEMRGCDLTERTVVALEEAEQLEFDLWRPGEEQAPKLI